MRCITEPSCWQHRSGLEKSEELPADSEQLWKVSATLQFVVERWNWIRYVGTFRFVCIGSMPFWHTHTPPRLSHTILDGQQENHVLHIRASPLSWSPTLFWQQTAWYFFFFFFSFHRRAVHEFLKKDTAFLRHTLLTLQDATQKGVFEMFYMDMCHSYTSLLTFFFPSSILFALSLINHGVCNCWSISAVVSLN